MKKKILSGALALSGVALTAGAVPAEAAMDGFENCPNFTVRNSSGAAGDYKIAFVQGFTTSESHHDATYWYEYQKRSGTWVDNGVRLKDWPDFKKTTKVMITELAGGTPVRVRADHCVYAQTKY